MLKSWNFWAWSWNMKCFTPKGDEWISWHIPTSQKSIIRRKKHPSRCSLNLMMFVPPFPKVGGDLSHSFQDIHEVTQPRQWAKKSSAGIGGSWSCRLYPILFALSRHLVMENFLDIWGFCFVFFFNVNMLLVMAKLPNIQHLTEKHLLELYVFRD